MKKHYIFPIVLSLFLAFAIFSCSESDDEVYVPVIPDDSGVSVDLTKVPYPKLSDYRFFEGTLKELQPVAGVLPFEPASPLFSDYAHKKRFVWMPKNTKATYNTDGKIMELPVGAVLIKTFYYDNVQNISPAGGTRIIETRLMIRKANGWIFANYIWNTAQTDAVYNMAGEFTQVSWKDENNVVKSTNYKIPNSVQCMVCHKNRVIDGIHTIDTFIPIGIKPQNLNFDYNYGDETKNQLTKWIEAGYLEDNFSLPAAENTVINYMDTAKPLELRVRSYVDANCAHCHMDNRHCDYRPMRFAFLETANNRANLGVCVNTEDMQDLPVEMTKIVSPQRPQESMLYYRINTTDEAYMMPLHGRSIIHEEGVALIAQWINSLPRCE